MNGISVALAVADHLCSTALRHRDRATWIGTTQDGDDDSAEVEFQAGTLGPDLYGGTAGIGLFLAEAFRHSGSPGQRDTAAAAIHQAMDQSARLPPELRLGFYEGLVGIAWAGVRAARLLDREDLDRRTGELLASLRGPDTGPLVLADLIAGATGGIPPLLSLAAEPERSGLFELACRAGEAVIAAARRGEDGWHWAPSGGFADSLLPLTGLAHGAAGTGWSLLELGRVSNRAEFAAAGLEAFRYENRWFRPSEDNWPDLREEEAEVASCCEAWCHGAPGIALSRSRAVAMGYSSLAPDLAAALRTTRRALSDRDEWIEGDFSLCHGIGGLALILFRDGGPADRALATEAAEAAWSRYGTAWERWPIGIRRGNNPSLMLGLAGIGYCYLGLADPALPLVLLPPYPG